MVNRQGQNWVEPNIREELLKLFHKWADPKVTAYEEPTRLGVSKGDPIGFPMKKYRAALLNALYGKSFNLADLAGLAGISHDQMRSWRREDQFKSVVNDSIIDFARFLIEKLFSPEDDKQAYILLRAVPLMPIMAELLLSKLQDDLVKATEQLIKDNSDISAWNNILTRLDFAGFIYLRILDVTKDNDAKEAIRNSMLTIFSIFLDNAITILRHDKLSDELKDIAEKIIRVVATFAPKMR